MPDPGHLKRLEEGVEVWNAWRKEHPEIRPNLSGALLISANLKGANLREVLLEGARLEKAHLSQAHLEKADLREAHLEKADLTWAHLGEACLWEAHLEKANLRNAHLEKADLTWAHLEKANLSGAHLEKADLTEAHLEKANLRNAHLEKADLRDAHLKKADLAHADLSGADLRVGYLSLPPSDAKHLRLDDTRILHSRFSTRSQDPWSVVRQAYSGPTLLFHLLFLLVFLVPYLSRALYWKGINASQETAAAVQAAADDQLLETTTVLEDLAKDPRALQELQELWRSGGLDVDRSRAILEEGARRQRERALAHLTQSSLRPIEQLGLCLRPMKECGSPQPIGPLLLGLHQTEEPALLRFLAVVLILYNVIRAFVTYYVSGLRDAEIRGGYSPPLRDYIWVYYLHTRFLKYVPIAAVTAAGFQIAEWILTTDVVLPVS